MIDPDGRFRPDMAAVASPGARDEIRRELQSMALFETRDSLHVA